VIVVSHDREFLDNVCNTTVEVTGAKLVSYAGNYSYYVEEKALRSEIQKGAYENQQSQIRQTERFIERFKAKATKARQVQSRVKALNRMDMIDDVIDASARVHFKFKFGVNPGRNVFSLENVNKAYGEKVILNNSTAIIERGDKIALIGANGKGKSTLLRIIAGDENVDGERKLGHNVNFSFFAQHQMESLHLEETLLEELKYADGGKSDTELRSVLGCFLFNGEDVFKKIKVLSGGEKSRVALAKVLISEANFLLLDEPTNHLDMQSVNILIQALDQYEGTYVVVSHDRHFVSQVANKIWYIEDYEIKEYPGTYDEFEEWYEINKQSTANNSQSSANVSQPIKKVETFTNKPTANANTIKKLERELAEIEAKITELERQMALLEGKLADPAVFTDNHALQRTNSDYELVKMDLKQKNELWEAKMLEMEG
jgi:ATP-binding cassette subfamily F protein 3